MKWTTRIRALGTGVALSVMLVAGPLAAQPGAFESLRGVDAQELSEEEMQAIAGELNAYDIAAALYAAAERNAKYPRLAASLRALADKTLANAEAINASFAKLGVLTPCTSSLCPK